MVDREQLRKWTGGRMHPLLCKDVTDQCSYSKFADWRCGVLHCHFQRVRIDNLLHSVLFSLRHCISCLSCLSPQASFSSTYTFFLSVFFWLFNVLPWQLKVLDIFDLIVNLLKCTQHLHIYTQINTHWSFEHCTNKKHKWKSSLNVSFTF